MWASNGSSAASVAPATRVRGRWVCKLASYMEADRWWPLVRTACGSGALGPLAKASTVDNSSDACCIVAFTRDACDSGDNDRVRDALRGLGMRHTLVFVPDVGDMTATGSSSDPVQLSTMLREMRVDRDGGGSGGEAPLAGSKRRAPHAGFASRTDVVYVDDDGDGGEADDAMAIIDLTSPHASIAPHARGSAATVISLLDDDGDVVMASPATKPMASLHDRPRKMDRRGASPPRPRRDASGASMDIDMTLSSPDAQRRALIAQAALARSGGDRRGTSASWAPR